MKGILKMGRNRVMESLEFEEGNSIEERPIWEIGRMTSEMVKADVYIQTAQFTKDNGN